MTQRTKKILMNIFDMSNWRYFTCCVMFMTVFFFSCFFCRRFSYLSAIRIYSVCFVRACRRLLFIISMKRSFGIRFERLRNIFSCANGALDVFNLVVSTIVFSSFPLFFVVSRYRFTCMHAPHGNIWHNERWIRALISHYFDAINSLAVAI